MATWQAIRALVDAFESSIATATLPAGHAGTRRPSVPADLPRLVVAASEVKEELLGIGGLVGARAVASDRWATSGGTRAAGIIDLELWGADESTVTTLADAVFASFDDLAALAAAGFMRLSPMSVGPIGEAVLGVGVGGTDTALLLPVTCRFVFERVEVAEEGPGGIIRRVHVDQFEERDGEHRFDEAIDLT